MNVQITYSDKMAKGYPGQVGDANPTRKITGYVEGAVIPFGRAVQQGTLDDQILLGTAGAGTYVGIAIRTHNQENVAAGVESAQYPVGDPAAIIQEGTVLVDLINTGAKGALIYSVDADGTIGAGTAVAGQTQIPGATLDETITAAGVARLRLKSE